jgi:hypothetical protein
MADRIHYEFCNECGTAVFVTVVEAGPLVSIEIGSSTSQDEWKVTRMEATKLHRALTEFFARHPAEAKPDV